MQTWDASVDASEGLTFAKEERFPAKTEHVENIEEAKPERESVSSYNNSKEKSNTFSMNRRDESREVYVPGPRCFPIHTDGTGLTVCTQVSWLGKSFIKEDECVLEDESALDLAGVGGGKLEAENRGPLETEQEAFNIFITSASWSTSLSRLESNPDNTTITWITRIVKETPGSLPNTNVRASCFRGTSRNSWSVTWCESFDESSPHRSEEAPPWSHASDLRLDKI